MELRPARIHDASAISALILSFSHEFTVEPEGAGAEQFLASVSAEAESGYIGDQRYQYIVAIEGARLVGFIAIRDRSHVFHLFVAAERQRQGLATRLWDAALSAARDARNSQCFTVNSSRIAVPVYERFGFRVSGEPVEKHGICFVPMQMSLGRQGGRDAICKLA
jgi:GNAT superfamily N-acetyltransferase